MTVFRVGNLPKVVARCGSKSQALTSCTWQITCPECRTLIDTMLAEIMDDTRNRRLDEDVIEAQARTIKEVYGVKL